MMNKKPIKKAVADKAYRPDRDGPKKRPTVTNKPLPVTPKPTVKPGKLAKKKDIQAKMVKKMLSRPSHLR
jgi:hypothetical protein